MKRVLRPIWMGATLTAFTFALVLHLSDAKGQAVLFDFDNAPVHVSLPMDLTVGGVTAHFSATGQGFSIQAANTMGFTPQGFAGNCIYPNSIYAADLLVTFSATITNFSILYSPQELGCDDSATMKVSAFKDGVLVGTNTATASFPGTWPTELLKFSSATGFNSVTIHYDHRPPTCQDWGPIFLADNMIVELAPLPIVITDAHMLITGEFQFSFSNLPGRNFSVFLSTNVALPFNNWALAGQAIEVSAGQYQFTDISAVADSHRFYRVSSP